MANDDIVVELQWSTPLNARILTLRLYQQDIYRLLAGHSTVPFDKSTFSSVVAKTSNVDGLDYVLTRHIHLKPDPCDDGPLRGRICVDALDSCTLSLNTSLTRYLKPVTADWAVFYDNNVICFTPLTTLLCLKVHWSQVINRFTCVRLGIDHTNQSAHDGVGYNSGPTTFDQLSNFSTVNLQ